MSPSNQKCIVLGVPSLKELFAERHYNDLDGGILENFGRLLSADMVCGTQEYVGLMIDHHII